MHPPKSPGIRWRAAGWAVGIMLLASWSLQAAALTITTTSLPNATVGTSYSAQLSAKGGIPPYSWSLDGFVPVNLDPNTGILSGQPAAGSQGQYTFFAVVHDQQENTASQQLTLTVLPCVPTITTASPLPGGDITVRYSTSLSGSGCVPPYHFVAQAKDPFATTILPEGLSLSDSGVLAGIPTPTSAGTYEFIIAITDSQKNQGSSPFSMTISALPTPSTTSPLPGGRVGTPYSVQITATGGTPFTGGGSPYIFSMNNNPPGLSMSPAGVLSGTPTQAGTFQFNIGVTDSVQGQTSSPFQVTFGNSVLQVTPASVSFAADQGGDSPPVQSIAVTPAGSGQRALNFQVTADNGPPGIAAAAPPSWLYVSPASAVAPAGVTVSASSASLGAGTYSARIRITDANTITTDVPVTFTVTNAAQKLAVLPAILHFAARAATPGTLLQNLLVSNSGGGGALGFSASVLGGSSWISLTPSSGTSVPNSPAVIQVNVRTEGLGIGSYRDVVEVTSSAGTVDVPVVLFVAGDGPILGVNTTGLLFRVLRGAPESSSRSLKVLNLGNPASTVNFSSTLATNAAWLSLGTANGSATTTAPASVALALSPSAMQLAPGAHYALLEISDPHALNSPQYVIVVLDVESSSALPLPDPQPAGLFFSATAGNQQPEGAEVTVNTSSSSPVPFQVAATTGDGGNWLSAGAPAGSTSGSAPGRIQVTANPAGLPAGIYIGNINVSMSGVLVSVNVTLVVEPSGVSTASRFRPAVTGCTPARLAITETGLVNNFAVPAGWPATLIAQLNDDCGNSVTSGSVVASFSNGDAPLTLRGDSLGNYSATWQPGAVTPQMAITLQATSGALLPATALLTGGVAQNASQPPVLSPDGIVHAFNRVTGGPLSPGTIVEVYGSGLASKPSSTGAPPLPTLFNGTEMLVGGLAAPLFYLSSGQLDVQIPAELAPNQQYMAVASANGALTLPVQIDSVPLEPGVAAYADGHVIAQHADYSLVNAAHPAKPGEVIIIYLLGMGPTNPAVESGKPAPSSEPLARVTALPQVTVAGQLAGVTFAGLTPGYSGLYQIDFTVPGNANSGDLTLVVSQNAVAANTTKLPVKQ